MYEYIFVDKTNNKITTLINYGKAVLPPDYPIPEDNIALGIPENFADAIRQKWGQVDIFVKDINVIMDSSKDYTEYFADTEIEQTQPVDPITDLKTQNSEMLLALVQGGLM